MDIQQAIYTEVQETRKSVNELNIRVTSVEIELRGLCKRANGMEARRWSRTDKFKIIALGGGWIFAVTTLILSLCHAI